MMRSLILLSVFVSLPALAVDLKANTQSSIYSVPVAIDGQKFEGFGRIGMGMSPTGMFFAKGQKVKLEVTIMQNATVVGGKHTTPELTAEEADQYMRNTQFLNSYIQAGGDVSIGGTPSPRDLSLAVQRLKDSNDVKVIRRVHTVEINTLKNELDFMKQACHGMDGGFGMGSGPSGIRANRQRGPKVPSTIEHSSQPAATR